MTESSERRGDATRTAMTPPTGPPRPDDPAGLSPSEARSLFAAGLRVPTTGSFTFEHPLLEAGVPVRHLTAGRNVPMYVTMTR